MALISIVFLEDLLMQGCGFWTDVQVSEDRKMGEWNQKLTTF